MPGDEVPTSFSPSMEIGRSGLRRFSGYVEEEFLPALKGTKGVQTFREMSENNPIAGGFIFAIVNLLRQLEWDVEAASDDPVDQENQEYLKSNMDDMSHSWSDMMSEIMTCVIYGWSWMEITYKRRVGPWESSPKRRSDYTDGLWGWRKIDLRAQETLHRWVFDDTGGIQAMVQMAPPRYDITPLPIGKSLLFRTSRVKNNPEGMSLLRNMYWPWFMMKRLCEHEAVGVERDLTGLPKATLPSKYFKADPRSEEGKMLAATKKIVRNVRRDENEGLVWPSHYDPDTKQEEFTFELMTSGGSRQFNTNEMIQRYATWQLVAVLADFLLLGQAEVGSYAMHTDKSGLFRTALNAIAEMIADVFNRHAVPKLFAINGNKPMKLPKIKPSNVENVNLAELAAFMSAMVSAGAQFFPDPKMEQFIRAAARLPELDPNQLAQREAQERQQEVLTLATQQLQMLQTEQTAMQGQMGIAQQQQGMDAQQQQMDAGPPGAPPPDPNAMAQGKVKVDREKEGLNRDKVKTAQEQQKLKILRKPPPKAPPNKSVKKSLHPWPVSQFSDGVRGNGLARTYNGSS